jgi:hypothetical protein
VIGRNGTGKSAAFDVLSLLRDFSIRGLPCEDRLAGETRTRWQPDVEQQRFEIDARIGKLEFHYVLVIDEWGTPRRPRVKSESVDCNAKPVFRFEMGEVHLFNDRHEDKVKYDFDWHRSALATIAERKDNAKLTSFKRWLGSVVHVQLSGSRTRSSLWKTGNSAIQEADIRRDPAGGGRAPRLDSSKGHARRDVATLPDRVDHRVEEDPLVA